MTFSLQHWGALAVSATTASVIIFWKISPKSKERAPAFILHNNVTHSRYLPKESAHSFTYPTFYLLLSLKELEIRQLELGSGYIFGFGTRWALTSLLSSSYFSPHGAAASTSLTEKLIHVLNRHDINGAEDILGGTWMMTMPNFLGFKGLNPLTVYFCYDKNHSSLFAIVLEVHNTFGERHVYVLQVGVNEDVIQSDIFSHQWTFPRQFHVSPFNDRGGHYVFSVTHPRVSPSTSQLSPAFEPKVVIRLQLLTPGPHPQKKLTAFLRTTNSRAFSTTTLLSSLAKAPFVLFSTLPRILAQASVLHYKKRLRVFARPEPIAAKWEIEKALGTVENTVESAPHDAGAEASGAIGWQDENWIERWCRRRVEGFLRKRTSMDHRLSVRLVPSQGDESSEEFKSVEMPPSSPASEQIETLNIYYRSPRFFTRMLICPSADHALKLAGHSENLFATSSDTLFTSVFEASHGPTRQITWKDRVAQSIRARFWNFGCSLISNETDSQHVDMSQNTVPIKNHPPSHPFGEPSSLMLILVLIVIYMTERLEIAIFSFVGAKFVEGEEPWAGWNRLGLESRNGPTLKDPKASKPWGEVGSVRYKEGG